MLIYHQQGSVALTSDQFCRKCSRHQFENDFEKYICEITCISLLYVAFTAKKKCLTVLSTNGSAPIRQLSAVYGSLWCMAISLLTYPGARFTNDFLPTIQIWWKLHLAVIPLPAIKSQQIFAHASCHVQNFVAITVLESRWERNVISIEFELRWKNR